MSVTRDILRAWRAPRAVMRGHLRAGVREDRALAFLMAACLLLFVARWPGEARAAYLDPSVPLNARLAGALLGLLFLAPLIFYALGAVSHLVARLFGGRGSFYSARLALFWSLLAVSPLALVQGLLAGFLGAGVALTTSGVAILVAFLVIWGASLYEAEQDRSAAPA
ncbi:ABC-type multidrug transport system permease subunit [Rhodobacteraceae bacterium MBR-64]